MLNELSNHKLGKIKKRLTYKNKELDTFIKSNKINEYDSNTLRTLKEIENK